MLLVRRAGGLMLVSGHVRLPPAMRFSDHCNNPESLLDIYDLHVGVFAEVSDSTHEMPYARFNREQALATWTSERRRGGDPHQRAELNEARVKLFARDFDVTGHVRLAEGAHASRMVMEGRTRFVTLTNATLVDHHSPDRAVELPLCLLRRDEVLMAVDEPAPSLRED